MNDESQEQRPFWEDLPSAHPYKREMAKWNKPYRYEEYPKMLYRAKRRPDGVVSVNEADDSVFDGQAGAAEAFSRGCQLVVHDEDEYLKKKGQGWCDGPIQALEAFHKAEDELATVAAHRHYEDRNLSPQAQAEAEAADSAGMEQVPAIPEKPRKGRPKKVA